MAPGFDQASQTKGRANGEWEDFGRIERHSAGTNDSGGKNDK